MNTQPQIIDLQNNCKKETEDFDEKTRKFVEDALSCTYLINTLKLEIEVETAQRMGEEEYDARVEYSLNLEISEEKNSHLLTKPDEESTRQNIHLLHMLNFFIVFINERVKQTGHAFTCAMMLSNKEFFDVQFCSANMEIPTKCFSFVNLIDRDQPLVHRALQLVEDPNHIMDRFYNRSISGPPTLCDFEHDKRQLVVRFPFVDRQKRETGIEEAEYIVSITVRYKSIRRVLANLKRADVGFNLELYFHVSSPPVIRRIKLFAYDPKRQNNLLSKQGDRYVAWAPWDPSMCEEINESPMFRVQFNLERRSEDYCQLINRLAMATERSVEFRTFAPEKLFRFRAYVESPLVNEKCRKMCENNFKLQYMIAALLSRGAVVKDYLLSREEDRDEFIKRCGRDFQNDRAVSLEVMEQVLAEIDKRVDSLHPALIYDWIFKREGYVRVRKVLITPSRMMFVAPELLMGNRVLRMDPMKYPLDTFLRVVFRDDDGRPVHATNVGAMLIDRFIGTKLRNCILVAGRSFNYFGSSNSQMRDNGCYFINATVEQIREFRTKLGSFKIQSAPKMMSRLAQCFTQARETGIELERRFYSTSFDYQGGRDSKQEPYCFSDGVGKISYETALELSRELKLEDCVPSCYQIRFRGFKGVLSVDKNLDSFREWGREHGIKDTTDPNKRDCWLDLKITFRPSQKKFQTQREGQKLEIVKYSSPVPICLNRPVNNILDQVSALQSKASHERICNRVHLLLDLHLHALTRALMDETKARNKLGEFPKVILYDEIKDLNLTKEPFFRSMVSASVRASLRKLRLKLQIPIPSSLGMAKCSSERQVLRGPIMITKNPSIVAGDIRMFTAVDIPALHYLCDVVVFPRYGPRPHTDEMAGSDLDGDEYTVIWDEQLYLDRNEEAFDYTSKGVEAEAVNEEDLRQKMAEFFVDYIKQDSIGRIGNAFLINSDLFGIKSEVCHRIACKHMEAVDFPKTGVPPKPLTNKWECSNPENEDEPVVAQAIPPERAERSPDFMEKNNEPMYISSRLNGQLYRRAREIDDILIIASLDEEELTNVEMDPLLYCRGWDESEVLELAVQQYEAYSANIQNILDCYGIKTEGELFSGHFTSLRNRISDRDSDDMSFYNTTNAIEQQLFSVFGKFRRQFFELPLEGKQNRYEEVTVPVYRYARTNGAKEVFRRMCHDPSDAYKKLACAYYRISYDSTVRRLLSFPCADQRFSFDPLCDRINVHVEEYVQHRKKQFRLFYEFIRHPEKAPSDEVNGYRTVQIYCNKYKGLDKLMFFTKKWVALKGLLEEGSPITDLHLCILVIQYGLNHLPCEAIESSPNWLEFIDPALNLEKSQQVITVNLERQHGGIGKKFLRFLEFLSSRQFNLLPFVDFNEPGIGYNSVLQQNQLLPLHKAALHCYHQIAFTFRFEGLPGTKEQRDKNTSPSQQVREGEPFIIEVPASRQSQVIHNQDLLNKLCDKTACTNIVFRDLPKYKGYDTVRLYVSSTGTMEALNSLRELLAVRAPLNLQGDCRQIFTQMAEQLFDRLINL
uniref:RNA-directed RNA polymerase n=1 Tax=Globodera rostochiensis TaxID=31243 RepID=A0A914IBG5_GLORO